MRIIAPLLWIGLVGLWTGCSNNTAGGCPGAECGQLCCQDGELCTDQGCCPSGQTCGETCCEAGDGCAAGACCPADLLCGDACCAATEACMAGACCPAAQTCGEACCAAGDACVAGACCPADQACGEACCGADEACLSGACCPTDQVCGEACCGADDACLAGACCATDQVCGEACCGAAEACVAGACCPTDQACGDACCPAGDVCAAGACCAADQACGDLCCAAGDACVAGACCPAAQACADACCAAGDACVAGGCCPPAQACTDQCCGDGKLCLGDTCCPQAQACGESCCAADETCLSDTCCPAAQACLDACCGAGDSCLADGCCPAGQVCGEACCGADQVCELGTCLSDCGGTPPCGPEQICCDAGQACHLDACLVPGSVCTSSADCAAGFFCDPDLGQCLPLVGTIPCDYQPGLIGGEFNTPVVEWEWSGADVLMPAAVANLTDDNGDGLIDEEDVPDVIVTTFVSSAYAPGTLTVLHGDTGQVAFTVDGLALNAGTGVAVGDVDGDGLPEIVACRATSGLYVLEHDGTLKWTVDQACTGAVSGYVYSSPAIADLEGDGVVEIISDYTIISGGAFRCSGPGLEAIGSMTVPLDIDGDGVLEVVGGKRAMDADCSLIWENPTVYEGHPAVADLDQDGLPEIVVGSDRLYVLNAEDGTEVVPPRAIEGGGNTTYAFAAAIDDFDGDGKPEIVLPGHASFSVYDLDCAPAGVPADCASGRDDLILWTSATNDGSGYANPAAFDFEGDGASEVVYADQYFLRIYRGLDGTVLYEEERTSGTLWEYPLVVDVDRDHHAEIVVVSENLYLGGTHQGVRVFGDSENQWVATRTIWNQFAYHITNIEEDGSVPLVQSPNWLDPELNNFRANRLLAAEGLFDAPDLFLSDGGASGASCPTSLALSVRVVNQGAAPAPAGLPVFFYHLPDAAPAALIGLGFTPAIIPPGESRAVSLDYVLAGPDVGLWLAFQAAINPSGEAESMSIECDEANNTSEIFYAQCAGTR